VLLQMAVVLTSPARAGREGWSHGASSPPRSSPVEKQGEIELPSYLGDNINGIDFTPESGSRS
jgi:3-deoxy-7-phosphoheptulonate synthase